MINTSPVSFLEDLRVILGSFSTGGSSHRMVAVSATNIMAVMFLYGIEQFDISKKWSKENPQLDYLIESARSRHLPMLSRRQCSLEVNGFLFGLVGITTVSVSSRVSNSIIRERATAIKFFLAALRLELERQVKTDQVAVG